MTSNPEVLNIYTVEGYVLGSLLFTNRRMPI